MHKWAFWLSFALVTWTSINVAAADSVQTTAHRRATLHAGPGHTYSPSTFSTPAWTYKLSSATTSATGCACNASRRRATSLRTAG